MVISNHNADERDKQQIEAAMQQTNRLIKAARCQTGLLDRTREKRQAAIMMLNSIPPVPASNPFPSLTKIRSIATFLATDMRFVFAWVLVALAIIKEESIRGWRNFPEWVRPITWTTLLIINIYIINIIIKMII